MNYIKSEIIIKLNSFPLIVSVRVLVSLVVDALINGLTVISNPLVLWDVQGVVIVVGVHRLVISVLELGWASLTRVVEHGLIYFDGLDWDATIDKLRLCECGVLSDLAVLPCALALQRFLVWALFCLLKLFEFLFALLLEVDWETAHSSEVQNNDERHNHHTDVCIYSFNWLGLIVHLRLSYRIGHDYKL